MARADAGANVATLRLAAQQELNELAPDERRGEVTAAFIACIYFLVASAVIATGLLDLAFSLQVSVAAVAAALAVVALAAAAWQAGVALAGWESYPASSPLSPRSRRASPRSRSLRSFFTERRARRAPPPRARPPHPHARPRR